MQQGLRQRCDAGLSGLTILSCDNLAENGKTLELLMAEYLQRHDPGLLDWFATHCTCPSTMVDRIVPATTAEDRAAIAQALGGVEDEGCVLTEPFSQWVIEDRFAGPRPHWDVAGAQFVADVAPFETAKLRLLNGAHSLLAYCGLARGHVFVHEAIADPELRELTQRMMRKEAAPTIAAATGQDLATYAEALVARFANPALNHRLIQIAMDGSQKIPQRWLHTLEDNRLAKRPCPALLHGIAAWLAHLRGYNSVRYGPVEDPRAAELATIIDEKSLGEAATALFAPGGAMGGVWSITPEDASVISGLC